MFAFVQNSRVFISIILGLIALTFVGFGLSSYRMTPEQPYLVKVGDVKIYKKDIDNILKNNPKNTDAKYRDIVLEQLIQQTMILEEAKKNGTEISLEQIASFIRSRPFLQENGIFSKDLYRRYLQSIGMRAEQFESQARRETLIQTQVMPILVGQIVSKTQAKQMASILGEERVVRVATISSKDFVNKVKLSDTQIEDYYKKHLEKYRDPEAVKAQYIILSQNEISDGITVSDADAQAFYEQHKKEIAKQQRYISHILLTVPNGASDSQKNNIKVKAEEILKQARANPSKFALLAKEKSQDSGSAAAGGRLGLINRGTMAKSFEDAAFALNKTGQISDIIETKYGFHILKLDEIKTVDFNSAKDEIIQHIKMERAAALYKKKMSELSDLAYNNNDLSQVASKLNLQIKNSDWVSRKNSSDSVMNNEKIINQLFSEDVLINKHNSDLIDLGSNNHIVVHVVDHRAEKQLPFSKVKASISAELTLSESAKLAENKGSEDLKKLQEGKVSPDIKWAEAINVSRRRPPYSLSAKDISAIFSAKVDKLPSYSGVKNIDGSYALFKIESVKTAAATSDSELKKTAEQLGVKIYAESQIFAYLDVLSKKYPVSKAKTN